MDKAHCGWKRLSLTPLHLQRFCLLLAIGSWKSRSSTSAFAIGAAAAAASEQNHQLKWDLYTAIFCPWHGLRLVTNSVVFLVRYGCRQMAVHHVNNIAPWNPVFAVLQSLLPLEKASLIASRKPFQWVQSFWKSMSHDYQYKSVTWCPSERLLLVWCNLITKV